MRFSLSVIVSAGAWWTSDAGLKAQVAARAPVKPITISLDLDQAPADRWKVLQGDARFATYKQDLTNYIGNYVPKALLPLLANIVAGLRKAFYADYAAEMEGLATALGVSIGASSQENNSARPPPSVTRTMRFSLSVIVGAGAWWTSDAGLKAQVAARAPVKPIKISLDLDQAPADRWKVLQGDARFATYKQDMTNYIGTYIPKALLPLVADIVAGLRKAFYADYAAEMEGLATALGVSIGDIVIANLIYQLENIGVTCDQRNVTGPCPAKTGPGMCTGVIVNGREDREDEIWQGRNLDWNLDASLLKYVLQVDYQKANQTLFTAVQIAGEVGILHGMRKGAFSVQLDARDEGGSVVTNLLELIAKGGEDPDPIWQGRNLDWNLDASLLKYVLQVDYQKANQTLFTAVQIAGEVGILHGMRKGAFSVQLDARDEGGSVVTNLLELIAKGAKTPTHVMRKALETAATFDAGVDALSGTEMANPAYFIVAGAAKGEGAILSMDRKASADTWHLYEESAKDTKHVNPQQEWFRLQTNYDHWTAAPTYDDRRAPGVAHVGQFCGDGVVDQACMTKVMTTWPTQNHHTDVTSIMCPRTGYFDVTVWINGTAGESVLV
eukprot:CAMPEP_0204449400 /NCGR_PEP_ID=MMETSP0470-20130426/99817_1 /ASSEMBLY_ACC=CAM_ASM_000385 /TAXON_ID=2969 /ORGANISM="Oxyrrhis marina" /LENGTH=611 /DNA_ID=CAMNT_0051449217 /DNA_START=50 /DNA_END=1885 /DNA_ORIENTATION=-